jgi:lycopene cyclase domain-containing protein
MTYFGFLLRFLVIPISVLLAITYWENRRNKPFHGFRSGHAIWFGIAIHVLLAVFYTTPWDNYLVATGVWYYNPDLVTGIVLGYVPIEEYTFFVLETILAGLWWWFLVQQLSPPRNEFQPNKLHASLYRRGAVATSTFILVSLWLFFTYLFFLGDPQWTYLSIILFWALPPIILQVLFGADILWHYRKLVFWAIAVPGTYLSLMDIIALRDTTWSISLSHTTGILSFGILPFEEVVFFFITNILLTFGMTLLLANVSQERFVEIKKQIQAWKEKWNVNPQAR